MGVKCTTPEYKLVFQTFQFCANVTSTLGPTDMSRELQLLLCGVQMVYQGEGQGVLFPPKVIRTATIGKVFCQAGRVRFFRVAARAVITKAFSRGLGGAHINEVARCVDNLVDIPPNLPRRRVIVSQVTPNFNFCVKVE